MKRIVVPFVALIAAALIGGVASVGLWEAVDDDTAPVSAGATTTVNRPVAATSGTVADIYEQTIPGVVEIAAQSSAAGQLGGQGGTATGSGWVLDSEGHIVTNQHVVDGADEVTVKFHDGTEVQADVVGTDPSSDVALVKLNEVPDDLQPLERGSSESLRIGDPVVAIGSPLRPRGHGHRGHRQRPRTASSRPPTASRSTARSRRTPRSTAATRAARCSTSNGRVVGMNSQIDSRVRRQRRDRLRGPDRDRRAGRRAAQVGRLGRLRLPRRADRRRRRAAARDRRGAQRRPGRRGGPRDRRRRHRDRRPRRSPTAATSAARSPRTTRRQGRADRPARRRHGDDHRHPRDASQLAKTPHLSHDPAAPTSPWRGRVSFRAESARATRPDGRRAAHRLRLHRGDGGAARPGARGAVPRSAVRGDPAPARRVARRPPDRGQPHEGPPGRRRSTRSSSRSSAMRCAQLCRRAKVHYADLLGHPIESIARVSGQAANMTAGRPSAAQLHLLQAHGGDRVRGEVRRRRRRRPRRRGHRPRGGLADVEDAAVDVPRLPRPQDGERADRARDRAAARSSSRSTAAKIVGLTIEAERLAEIRTARVRSMGGGKGGYANAGADLRGARRGRRGAPKARLPRDRRHRPLRRGDGAPDHPLGRARGGRDDRRRPRRDGAAARLAAPLGGLVARSSRRRHLVFYVAPHADLARPPRGGLDRRPARRRG